MSAKLDIELINQRLLSDPKVRAKILRDYGIQLEPSDPEAMVAKLIEMLDQPPSPNPLEQELSNAAVFRAAVRALGSNSRAWTVFAKAEPDLRILLGNYDPLYAHRTFEEGEITLENVRVFLPGQSSSADARAIRRWAQLLAEVEGYYGHVRALGLLFRERALDRYGESLSDPKLLLCLSGYLGDPPTKGPKLASESENGQPLQPQHEKLPGMKYVLASEFLRNLGWNGFKPDRHVKRLFGRWCPQVVAEVKPEVERMRMLIGRNTKDLRDYLTYSLVGISLTPPGTALSYVDNLVWLLGAYVERKGKESDYTYVVDDAN